MNIIITSSQLNGKWLTRVIFEGGDDNVISQIQRTVKEVAFPGSAQEVDKLIKNQRNSYFVDGEPQLEKEGSQRRKGPLSSILGAF